MGYERIAVAAALLGLAGAAVAGTHGHGTSAPKAHGTAAPAAADAHGADARATPAASGAPAATGHGAHWGYDGMEAPVHWAHISPDYSMCAVGHSQSPIDLALANTEAEVQVATDYKVVPLRIMNNGHTVQVSFPEGATLTSSGRRFNLMQVHFHTPSEHTIDGKHYPLEAHFVHRDATGHLAVLGILFEEGPTNVELAKVIVAAPRMTAPDHPIEGFTFDPRALVPGALHVYRYMGSLTTPPCSEGVNWHVATKPAYASAAQIASLASIMGNNARPIQPFNERLLIASLSR